MDYEINISSYILLEMKTFRAQRLEAIPTYGAFGPELLTVASSNTVVHIITHAIFAEVTLRSCASGMCIRSIAGFVPLAPEGRQAPLRFSPVVPCPLLRARRSVFSTRVVAHRPRQCVDGDLDRRNGPRAAQDIAAQSRTGRQCVVSDSSAQGSGRSAAARRTGQFDLLLPFKIGPMNGREAREGSLRLTAPDAADAGVPGASC